MRWLNVQELANDERGNKKIRCYHLRDKWKTFSVTKVYLFEFGKSKTELVFEKDEDLDVADDVVDLFLSETVLPDTTMEINFITKCCWSYARRLTLFI